MRFACNTEFRFARCLYKTLFFHSVWHTWLWKTITLNMRNIKAIRKIKRTHMLYLNLWKWFMFHKLILHIGKKNSPLEFHCYIQTVPFFGQLPSLCIQMKFCENKNLKNFILFIVSVPTKLCTLINLMFI